MDRNLLAILVASWGLFAHPVLCTAGQIQHACECEDAHDSHCDHECDCADDPCELTLTTIVDIRLRDHSEVAPVAIFPAVRSTAIEPSANARPDVPPPPTLRRIPYPPTDQPLRI